MKILIITDAWHPQVNGVVTTLSNVTKELTKAGYQADIVEPNLFKSIPLPGYNEINIATVDGAMEEMIKKANGKRTIPQIFFDDQKIFFIDWEFFNSKKKDEAFNYYWQWEPNKRFYTCR